MLKKKKTNNQANENICKERLKTRLINIHNLVWLTKIP